MRTGSSSFYTIETEHRQDSGVGDFSSISFACFMKGGEPRYGNQATFQPLCKSSTHQPHRPTNSLGAGRGRSWPVTSSARHASDGSFAFVPGRRSAKTVLNSTDLVSLEATSPHVQAAKSKSAGPAARTREMNVVTILLGSPGRPSSDDLIHDPITPSPLRTALSTALPSG